MDRNSLLNDQETALRYAQDELQSRMWTSGPAIVQKVNFAKMTCEIQPAIQGVVYDKNGNPSYVNLPLLVDCPLIFPSAGGVSLTLPIKANDEVLFIIASRCIDAWWQQGNVQPPIELRMHDLSDGFALPGPRSQPHVLPSISTDAAQLRNDAGTLYFGVNKTTNKLQVKSPTQSLKGVLSDMIGIESSINTALITFATGLNPGTLAAQAATLVTSLGPVTTNIALVTIKLGQLLE